MAIHELAPAKINLTLTVLGRRHDGFHELESLVTFADIGDALVLRPGPNPKVVVTGPFAGDIIGQNLLHTALQLLQQRDASLHLGSVELVKNIPVAAGLYAALAKFFEDEKKHAASHPEYPALKDTEVFQLLVFFLRFGRLRSNGRPRSRAFITFLRSQFPPEAGVAKEEPRIILP